MVTNPNEIIPVRFSRQELDNLSKELDAHHAHLTMERFQDPRRLDAVKNLKYIIDRELANK